jgi:hypothetical protein
MTVQAVVRIAKDPRGGSTWLVDLGFVHPSLGWTSIHQVNHIPSVAVSVVEKYIQADGYKMSDDLETEISYLRMHLAARIDDAEQQLNQHDYEEAANCLNVASGHASAIAGLWPKYLASLTDVINAREELRHAFPK